MESNKEGTSTIKRPLLDGSYYAYWKIIMVAFLWAIDDDVWDCVEVGDGNTVLNPKSQWTQGERNLVNWNHRAINGTHKGVAPAKFHKISTCSTAKEAWDRQIVHEGTDTVKQTKI